MASRSELPAPANELTALETAGSATAAAEAVVDLLVEAGIPLPSLYLEQAGRLRCLAQRGYWQVLDGIPPDIGVMGRSFRSGETVEVTDAEREEQFLFAAPDLQRQISVPIRHAGEVVGTLNVESRGPFPAGTRALVEQVAAAFAEQLTRLGGPPPESTAQRVARLATAMTELDREADIRRTVLEAAVQVSGMSTAAVIEPDGPGTAQVVAAIGPLRAALSEVAPVDLSQLDGFVSAGSSLFAAGTAASDLDVHGRLRTVGVAALAVVSLTASGEHLGSLAVASGEPQVLEPVVMPVLEILGAQAAASIRAVRTVAELRRRARQDPLTQLGHHATFHEELRARLADPPVGRQLAVLVIDVDDFKVLNDRDGHQAGDRVLRQLSDLLGSVLRSGDRLYRVGGDEFATIIEVDTGVEAEDIARRMVEVARQGPTTVSIGVAIACPGEDATELVDRADGAMYRAKGAGRDTAGVAAPRPRRTATRAADA